MNVTTGNLPRCIYNKQTVNHVFFLYTDSKLTNKIKELYFKTIDQRKYLIRI